MRSGPCSYASSTRGSASRPAGGRFAESPFGAEAPGYRPGVAETIEELAEEQENETEDDLRPAAEAEHREDEEPGCTVEGGLARL